MASYTVETWTTGPLRAKDFWTSAEPVHYGTGPAPRDLRTDVSDTDIDWEVADPVSVGGGLKVPLDRTTIKVTAGLVRCYLYQLKPPSNVPLAFAAVASARLSVFSNVNMFFHPNPYEANYPDDGSYPYDDQWQFLYRYAWQLGCQLAVSGKNQIFIMPYVSRSAQVTLGILPANWRQIVTDIVKLIHLDMTGKDEAPDLESMVVSAFSYGVGTALRFIRSAVGLKPFLREVWDFDGWHSTTERAACTEFQKLTGVLLLQYDQNGTGGFHVPVARWDRMSLKRTNGGKAFNATELATSVHNTIPFRLFYHACSLSKVG